MKKRMSNRMRMQMFYCCCMTTMATNNNIVINLSVEQTRKKQEYETDYYCNSTSLQRQHYLG